jgi:uncharacterized protein (TIGR00299 family) protein
MTIAYFDCFSGASGDMILGALIAAGADLDILGRELEALGLDGVTLEKRFVQRQGITATKLDVIIRGQIEGPGGVVLDIAQGPHPAGHSHNHNHDHDHDHNHDHDHEETQRAHQHRTLSYVEARLAKLPEPARAQATAIFRRLAEAEARVHGTTATSVHFHEVGMDDAIADVAGTVLALRQLGVSEVQCSPLPLGSGTIRCAHGMMPVPVPAVVELVRGLPTYDNGETGELVTPTGAAILAELATRFGPPPAWTVGAVGYGAGGREGKYIPNLLRVMLGRATAAAPEESLVELAANIDDLNPQFYNPLLEKLLAAGALDVTLTPTLMKKGRPGIVLSALLRANDLDAAAGLIFRETTTLGLRYQPVYRRVLERERREAQTPWGTVRVKFGRLDGQIVNVAPEFEDCRRLAEQAGVPLKEVWQVALGAARQDLADADSRQS